MLTSKPKYILIAPLDWGLGHTTRCVPIIRHIRDLGHIPILACTDSQRSFIEETLGSIDTVLLDGYNISYSRINRWAQAGLLAQLPRISRTIHAEHRWLLQLTAQRRIDGIISDNRYGLWHPQIPSVILTHQLMVQSGIGALADRIIQTLHYKHLNRFGAVWVPDMETNPANNIELLAGSLSHTALLPKKTHYVGLLSRFAKTDSSNYETAPFKAGGSLLILLSGPEPQRTELSEMLWQQVQGYTGDVIFVEGSKHASQPLNIPSHIKWYARVAGDELHQLLQQASMVICRSGYSTLMDLVALNKKAILIPTPGQTEQQYLARTLHKAGIFPGTTQDNFQLQAALAAAAIFPFHSISLHSPFSRYKDVVDKWIDTLCS